MSKTAISVILAVLLGGAVSATIYYSIGDKSPDSGGEDAAVEIARLGRELADTRQEVARLEDQIARLDAALSARRAADRAAPPTKAAAAPEEAASSSEQAPKDLRQYVFALIDEERQLREEEREQQREEMRQRMEERRQQMEEFRQGPYDRYNLKVNSLAHVLQLDDAQKERYFEITKKYSEAFEEARTALREERGAAQQEGTAEAGRDNRRGRRGGGEDRTQYRELSEKLQKEFAAEVEPILTEAQFEIYSELPEWTQSFQNLGMVTPPGEDAGRAAGFMGGMREAFMGGRAAGGPGGGRRGRGGGR